MRYFLFLISILFISGCSSILEEKPDIATEKKQVQFKNPTFENTWEPLSWQPYKAMKIYPDRLEFIYDDDFDPDYMETGKCKLIENEQTYVIMHCQVYAKAFGLSEENIKFALEWKKNFIGKVTLSYGIYSEFNENYTSNISWFSSKEPTRKSDLHKTREQ